MEKFYFFNCKYLIHATYVTLNLQKNRTSLNTVFIKKFFNIHLGRNHSSRNAISIYKPLTTLPGTSWVIRCLPPGLFSIFMELNGTEHRDVSNESTYQQVFILLLQLVDGRFLPLEKNKQRESSEFPLWVCIETAALLNLFLVRY